MSSVGLAAVTLFVGLFELPTLVLASPPGVTAFIQDVPTTPLPPGTLSPAGGSQPHDNLMPYSCVTYIISFYGIFPNPT